MATGDVIIRIRSDSKDFQADVDKARKRLDGLSKSSGDAANGLRDGAGALAKFKSALGDTAVYGGAFMLLNTLAQVPGKVIAVGNAMQGLNASFLATFKTQEAASQQLQYASQLAETLGMDVLKLSEDYGKWAAATESTVIGGRQQQEIFEAVAGAAKVLNLSADDSSGALRALGQMMSKGKVQAEELRGQLGERIPGAFQMAADAMGVTTAELDKMLEDGKVMAADLLPKLAIEMQKTYGGEALAKAQQSLASNTARLRNELVELADNGFKAVEPALNGLVSGLSSLAEHQDTVIASVGLVSVALAGRGAGALATYTSGKLAAAQAARVLAAAELQASQQQAAASVTAALAAERAASAQLSRTQTALAAANAERASAAAALMAARGTDGYSAALVRSIAAHEAASAAALSHAASQRGLAVATTSTTVAQNAATAATGRLAVASRALGGALALVGGPAGAAVLALGGLFLYREELMELVTHSGKAKRAGELHAEAMDKAKDAAYQYADATEDVRKELDSQKNSELAATKATVEGAKAALEAARTKLAAARTMAEDGGDNAALSGFGSYDSEAREVSAAEAMLAQQEKALKELEGRYELFGKTKEELDQKFTEDETTKAEAVKKTTAAVTASTAASVEAGKVLHSHGDAIKSLVESLTQQRIEIENGKLAADYFAKRLQGLSDAEARAAIGAGQYNTYLEERKRLTREAADASGGLRSAYLARLDEMGLSTEAVQGIDAAKLATDKAVMASAAYQASIDKATESLKAQAEAAKAAGTSAAGAMSAQLGGIQKISSAAAASAAEVVGKLQALGWTRNQAIGIAANIKQESEFRPGAVGDGGKAYGLAQWHHDRQAIFHAVMGKNIQGSSVDDQLKFLTKEMFMQTGGGAGKRIKASDSAAEVAAIMSRYYERPKETEVEITRRAGIANAIAKSLGGTVPSFRAAAAEAGKVAPAIAAAAPALDANASKTRQLADQTAEYAGAIDGARVSQQGINGLVDDYMQGQADGLVRTAEEHLQQVKLTGAALREWELSQKEFNAGARERILLAEQSAEYAAEEVELQKALYGIRNQGIAATYVSGLSNKNLTKAQIGKLLNQKMEIEFTSRMTDLDGRAEQANLTADAYQHLTMARDGFTNAQIEGFQAWEREVRQMEGAAEVNKKFADAFESDLGNALKSGKLNFQGFADTVIDEITRLQVIKPLMESLFGNDGKGGLFSSGQGGLLGSITSLLGFADGGAFEGGVQMYANGGAFHNAVLHHPTQFFANGGLAVAGEAGPEAVMPLTRIGGRLGVMAAGGNTAVTVQPQVNLHVVNNAGVKIESSQRTDANGNINMTLMVEQIEGALTDRARRGQGLANVFARR